MPREWMIRQRSMKDPIVTGSIKSRHDLPASIAEILDKLKPLLRKYNADNSDPVRGDYRADHSHLDGLFDNVKFTLSDGILTIINKKTGAVIFTGKISDIKNGNFDEDNLPDLGTIPEEPDDVTAVGGAGQVTISWKAVSNATSYNIYWSMTSPVTKATGKKITGASRPYFHTGLAASTKYYYIVTAVNGAGESEASEQATATTNADRPTADNSAADDSAYNDSGHVNDDSADDNGAADDDVDDDSTDDNGTADDDDQSPTTVAADDGPDDGRDDDSTTSDDGHTTIRSDDRPDDDDDDSNDDNSTADDNSTGDDNDDCGPVVRQLPQYPAVERSAFVPRVVAGLCVLRLPRLGLQLFYREFSDAYQRRAHYRRQSF